MNDTMENLIQLDFSEEMKNSYRDYAMSVIISRALPDVRDGLKPVQRRILYAMNELALSYDKPHRKSARIVGDTMGKYHPHGDSSIYDALVHMTEDYSLNIPLVDGHGNFGSIDGDGAAAMRYTEARLSRGAMTMLENLDKGLVPFMPNFDESEKEPMVLPATLPNLLINGTTGIAVGMATNIPPHNPGEVIDGVIAYLDNPDITLEKLMKKIPAPDFPTGGIIVNQDDIYSIYTSGEGKLKIRARTEIEKGEKGRKNIVITEIPYTVAGNKTKLVESISALMREKVFDEIYDVRDESSKEGIRIVIEVKKDRDVNNLLNGLYKKTAMEDTYGVNMLAVKDKQPITFTLKQMLHEFVVFQEELYTKEYQHLYAKAKERLEIVEGLIKATDVIDLIIEILRGSNSVRQAKACLIKGDISDINFKSAASKKQALNLNFTERQADAILAMPLGRLIGLEIIKLHQDCSTLISNISEYRRILEDTSSLHDVIKSRLTECKKLFGHPRRTELDNAATLNYVETVKEEDLYILVDRFSYMKSLDSASFHRLTPEAVSEYTHIARLRNTDKLCVFTNQGNLYQIKAMSIPKARNRDKGVLVHTLCKMDNSEDALLYIGFQSLFESQLVFQTRLGYVKQVSGTEFETNRLAMLATKLSDDDTVAAITVITEEDILSQNRKVVVLTEKGRSLAYPLEEIPELKKTGRGVKSITLDKDDSVAFATVLAPEQDTFTFDGISYSARKVRMRKRAAKGTNAQIKI